MCPVDVPFLDTDGAANGRIVDPHGPGVGGVAAAPALSPLGVALALLSLLAVAVLAWRRRFAGR